MYAAKSTYLHRIIFYCEFCIVYVKLCIGFICKTNNKMVLNRNQSHWTDWNDSNASSALRHRVVFSRMPIDSFNKSQWFVYTARIFLLFRIDMHTLLLGDPLDSFSFYFQLLLHCARDEVPSRLPKVLTREMRFLELENWSKFGRRIRDPLEWIQSRMDAIKQNYGARLNILDADMFSPHLHTSQARVVANAK